MSKRRWLGRIALALSFGALAVSSISLEFLEWRIRGHEVVYAAFFALAGVSLVTVLLASATRERASRGQRDG